MDSLPMRNIEAFPKSDRFLDVLAKLMNKFQALFLPMTEHVKGHQIGLKKNHLVQRLLQQFLQVIY